MAETIDFLAIKAYKLRYNTVVMTTQAGSGHITSCLSCAEIVAVLFFEVMRFDPDNYDNQNNDRFILSKGHAAPILYAVWHELGKITETELLSYRTLNSPLEGHPTRRFAYAECATGSLGIGLSVGVGEALFAKIQNKSYRTFVLLGDSELSEGSIWESIFIAAYYKLDNLVVIVDVNRLGQSTETMFGTHIEKYKTLFAACGWNAIIVKQGHDTGALERAFSQSYKKNVPTVIIAHTIKGYGISRAEDKNGFHGKAFSQEQLPSILQELKKRFAPASKVESKTWKAKIPDTKHGSSAKKTAHLVLKPTALFKKEKEIATRKAYGITLAELGIKNEQIVSLDAEVKNSTFAEIFEAAHPDRFVQCFVAEQNMIGMAMGFHARGAIPFVSTFACFLTRAYDQLRMAAIGRQALRVVGSHAGVSIGQDGPSQMGLEDISITNALQNSVILYPCDAVSTAKLMNIMLEYTSGISYLRTTREETPMIYNDLYEFILGGFHVLKKSEYDALVVIAAGITVFESVKAYDLLKKENIFIRVIDLYCVKPINAKKLSEEIKKAGSRVIIVEDHYKQGGIGEIVISVFCNEQFSYAQLAINEIPTSASSEEQRKFHKIDAAAIVKVVKQFVHQK